MTELDDAVANARNTTSFKTNAKKKKKKTIQTIQTTTKRTKKTPVSYTHLTLPTILRV